jgi:xylulose-5-phosphate/fructose-6-phosphate phosphoketolase
MEDTMSNIDQARLNLMQRYWDAANYLTVGQIYLQANPLLREPLRPEHIKPRLLGHWGTSPGLSFIYLHLNRLIQDHDVNMIYLAGPGHGGPALVANVYLEGTYSEVYPQITQDAEGMRHLFRQFSTPGGIPSHVSVPTPGSIHEGGELGYVLVHAFGAAFDNPDLIVAAVVGDGEAETGPLAGSWKSIKFLDPVRDGAVLPILHLNGYKISGPTVLGRASDESIQHLIAGHGYEVHFVEGDDPMRMHQAFADTLDLCYAKIRAYQEDARQHGFTGVPKWPAIILRTPKGWTGPKEVDGLPIEGTFRAHQVPVDDVKANPNHLNILEVWMRSYHPEALFDEQGRFLPELAALAPKGDRRMGANPHANGGKLLRDLDLPDFTDYAVEVKKPATGYYGNTRQLGKLMRDMFTNNAKQQNFRLFCPDETNSNRLGDVFEVENRTFEETIIPIDDHLSPAGRVMEVLSEHLCEGWLDCTRGLSIWHWAGNEGEIEPDVVLACAGDVMTMETVAAAWWLRHHIPELKVRVVNVVDLTTLYTPEIHPHGLDDATFIEHFTEDKPVVFAFHGYQRAIHQLIHGRPNPARFHVRGFNEQGTTTTPFDMVVLNQVSRYHLCILALERARRVQHLAPPLIQECNDMLAKHHSYVRMNFEDMPEVRDWVWTD